MNTEMMKQEMTWDEINAVSGGNALDTTTGSFLTPDECSDVLLEKGYSAVAAYWICY